MQYQTRTMHPDMEYETRTCEQCGNEPARHTTTWGDACIREYLSDYGKRVEALGKAEVVEFKRNAGRKQAGTLKGGAA